MTRIPLGVKILFGAILGALLGMCSKTIGIDMKILGDAFIRMIQMTIVPLVFPLIVLGVAQMKSVRSLGRLAGKAILYFEIVTTVIIILSVFLADITNVGSGVNLADASAEKPVALSKGIEFNSFILNMIPKNIFEAFTQGNLLAIVFFGIFFGLALSSLTGKAPTIENVLRDLSSAMFKVIHYVIGFSPIGVFGFIAFDVASYGLEGLKKLGGLILVGYLGLFIVLLVLFPLIAKIFKVKYFEMIREIWDLLIIAFTTRSSEVVFAPLMERLERYGAHNTVVSLVLPLGYSFNLDGGTLYMAPAILFLANAYGLHLSMLQQLELIGLLMILTKGIAGVPSANIVVLMTAVKSIGLPVEGIALLMAIDFIMDMARTATNVVGNSLATLVMAKSERMYHPDKIQPDGFMLNQPESATNSI